MKREEEDEDEDNEDNTDKDREHHQPRYYFTTITHYQRHDELRQQARRASGAWPKGAVETGPSGRRKEIQASGRYRAAA